MKLLMILLLLLAPVALAGQQDVYVVETQRIVAELQYKVESGIATDRDRYMLDYYLERLAQVTFRGASRTGFTSAIANREPVDDVNVIDYSLGSVTFFTELINVAGTIVTHQWWCDGVMTYRQQFPVGGNRWRVWSSKALHKQENIVVQVYINNELVAERNLAVR